MDLVHLLPAFVVAVVLISASPGPAVALILRRAALGGSRGAVPTVFGLEAGLYAWALLAAAGFSALVAASEVAFLTLRVVGAVVLVGLGVRAWPTARRAGGSAGRPYDGGSRSSAAPCSSPSASGWPPATEPYAGNPSSATAAPVAVSRWW